MAVRLTDKPWEVKPPIKGMRRDVAPSQIAPGEFLTLNNWEIKDGQLTKVSGWQKQGQTVTGGVSLIGSAKYGDNTYQTLVGTQNFLYWMQLGTAPQQLNAQDFQDPSNVRWQACVYQNKLFLTDGLHYPQVWDGHSSAMTDLSAVGAPKGRTITQFQNHLILGNVADQSGTAPDTFAGSGLPSSGGYNDWNYANSASDAYENQLATVGDVIQNMTVLNNTYLAAYKEFSLWLINFIGEPYVYQITGVTDSIGASSPWGIVKLPQYHVFLGQDDIYQFNGAFPTGFGERIWEYLVSQTGINHLGDIWAFQNVFNREVYFVLPNGTAIVWNYLHDAFYQRDFPFTAAGIVPIASSSQSSTPIGQITSPISAWTGQIAPNLSEAQMQMMLGDSNGVLYLMDEGTKTDAGAEIVATAETGDINFGDTNTLDLVDGMEIDVQKFTGTPLQVYVSARRNLTDAVTYAGPYLYNPDGARQADFISQGVWHRFKFVKSDGTCTITGFRPLYQESSRW
jgi:hypothetical protein